MPARRKRSLVGVGIAAVVVIAVLALLLTRSHVPSAPGAAANDVTTTPTLSVSRITADFRSKEFATYYTVTERSSIGVSPTIQWHLDPPAVDKTCSAFSVNGAQAIWRHADSDGCNHNVQGPTGHLGTVSVTVSDGQWTCKAAYPGTNTGKSELPQCAKQ